MNNKNIFITKYILYLYGIFKVKSMSSVDFVHICEGVCNIVNRETPLFLDLSLEVITEKRNNQNRNIKQLVGHMIDSACNNQQRMVRLQYNKSLVFPDYTQDNDLWIALQDYEHADWYDLVHLWKFYNLHIVRVIKAIDLTALCNYWHDYEGNKVTLRDMIEGYLSHLNLHVNEIHELIGE